MKFIVATAASFLFVFTSLAAPFEAGKPWENCYREFEQARLAGDGDRAWQASSRFLAYAQTGFFPNDWRVKRATQFQVEERARRHLAASPPPSTLVVRPLPDAFPLTTSTANPKPRRSSPRTSSRAFERVVKRAEREQAEGRWESALWLFQQAHQMKPESEEVRLKLERLNREMDLDKGLR